MSEIKVIYPSIRSKPFKNGIVRVPLEFTSNEQQQQYQPLPIDKLRFVVFTNSQGKWALVKDIAASLNYPSSYQLIKKFLKKVPDKSWLKRSDPSLNDLLVAKGLIDEVDSCKSFFYVSLDFIGSIIANTEVLLVDNDDPIDSNEDIDIKLPKDPSSEDDSKVLLSQVFPQYESRHIPLVHSSFNTLSNLTKLNFYRSLPNAFQFLPNAKLNVFEREILMKENEYIEQATSNGSNTEKDNNNIGSTNSTEGQEGGGSSKSKQIRKLINRNRKHNINVDPNTLDLHDSIIPGQGYIQEFSVKHLCKVPNYFITSSTQPIASSSTTSLNAMRRFGGNTFTSNKQPYIANETTVKLSKNLQKLIYNNENDHRNTKYYYVKSYRGPGSGNYKDAALMNKVNKIPLTTQPIYRVHKSAKEVSRYDHKRQLRSLKGLLCEKISQDNFESILDRQREFVEDFDNMEVLHNNLQFNVLVNSYREISANTWDQYYKFKTTDHDQLASEQRLKKKHNDYQDKFKEYQEKEQARQQKLVEVRQKQMEQYHKQQNPAAAVASASNLLDQDVPNMNEFTKKKEKKIRTDETSDKSDNSSSDNESELERQSQKPLLERLADEIRELEIPIQPPTPPSPDQIAKFVLPNEIKEVYEKIPYDLREPGVQIKKPIYSSATYADTLNAQFLNKIEMIRIPNPNSIGWDNFKKYNSRV